MSAKKIFLFLIIHVAAISFAEENNPKKIINKVEDRLSSAATIHVQFTENFLWKLTGEKQSFTGQIIMDNHDRFRITTDDQIIVSDGKELWTYNQPANRVLIDKLDTSDDALLPRRIFFHYKKDYGVRISEDEPVNQRPCKLLVFDAKPGEVFFPRVFVWIDKETWIPRKIKQVDLNGNETVYILDQVQFEKEEPKDVFKFTIPKDAEVIRMQ